MTNNSENRSAILGAIRRHTIPPVKQPELANLGLHYDDPIAQFHQVLEHIGGTMVRVTDRSQLAVAICELEVYKHAKNIACCLTDTLLGNVDLDQVNDPRDLNTLDLAILPGEFAVAENAAVWVTDQDIKHRVVYVIAEHLVLVVDANQLVHNMHDAYDRLQFDHASYGSFIAGPSKTADIAGQLVKGAQGARSLHVVLAGPLSTKTV